MLQVEMTEDIRKYDTKFLGPFTKRQTICVFLSLISLPIGFLIPFSEPAYRIVAICLLAAPIAMCGWVKMDGTYLEVLFIRYLYLTVLTPPKRKQISDNTIKELIDYRQKQLEKKKLATLTKKQRKLYEKKKAAQKVIKYYNNDAKDKTFKIYC